METEEGGPDEKVVHRVQVDAAHRGEDKEQKEEQKQGYGRREDDLLNPGSGVEAGREDQAQIDAGEQIFVAPGQAPSVGVPGFRDGRYAVIRKVDFVEVGPHHQFEVRYLVDAIPETVPPLVLTLRAVGYVNGKFLAWREIEGLDQTSGADGHPGDASAVYA